VSQAADGVAGRTEPQSEKGHDRAHLSLLEAIISGDTVGLHRHRSTQGWHIPDHDHDDPPTILVTLRT
jgi:hypothetical protein